MVRHFLDFVNSALNKGSLSFGDETDQRTCKKKKINKAEGGLELA